MPSLPIPQQVSGPTPAPCLLGTTPSISTGAFGHEHFRMSPARDFKRTILGKDFLLLPRNSKDWSNGGVLAAPAC